MKTSKTNIKPIEILLIEDNEGDIILTQEAFKCCKIANVMHIARDGEEALNFLRKNKQSNASTPDLILLDLNLPKLNGKQVLKEIKEDDNLKHIPVVVLTSSQSEQDIVKSYNLYANSYITKPVNLDKFIEIVDSIENFWFSVVTLPYNSAKAK